MITERGLSIIPSTKKKGSGSFTNLPVILTGVRDRDIDMEAMRTFAPFELKGLDGQQHRLQDYLDKITLVSFFFPT